MGVISVTIGEGNDLEESSCRLYCFGDVALLVVVVEDGRAVLRADVVALAVERRGVVRLPEDAEQVFERDFGRVVRDLHDLGVAGGSRADLFVGRV